MILLLVLLSQVIINVIVYCHMSGNSGHLPDGSKLIKRWALEIIYIICMTVVYQCNDIYYLDTFRIQVINTLNSVN